MGRYDAANMCQHTFWAFLFLQTATTALIKIAILILYRRIFVTGNFQRAVKIVGAIKLADSIAIFFVVYFYCYPIEHLWNPTIPGKCINRVYFIPMTSSTLFLTDLMVNVMPLPVIWKLYMTTRRKLELTLIFLLGGL